MEIVELYQEAGYPAMGLETLLASYAVENHVLINEDTDWNDVMQDWLDTMEMMLPGLFCYKA